VQLTRIVAAVALLLVCSVGVGGRLSAQQSLNLALFGSYLESFREGAAIPALSVAVVQHGAIVWERGFGRRDIDTGAPATPDTPYLVGELSQVLGSTLLLRKCVDQWYLRLTDRMERWNPQFAEPSTSVMAVLGHIGPDGTYAFTAARFASLTAVIEECGVEVPYARLLADELFIRFHMGTSVPGPGLLASPTARLAFEPEMLTQYENVLRGAATPYRIDRGRAVRNELLSRQPEASAATGVMSSAHDLASFLGALDRPGVLLSQELLDLSSRPLANGTARYPTGPGWFVQDYTPPGGAPEPLMWQFGMIKDGYSGMILRLPRRSLSVVMLANSDGLVAPFALDKGDATASLFARLFLRIFAV
jgi:CubicO group peptidase (beta-lactamase class C family)